MYRTIILMIVIIALLGAGLIYFDKLTTKEDSLTYLSRIISTKQVVGEHSSEIGVDSVKDVKCFDIGDSFEIVYGNFSFEVGKEEVYSKEVRALLNDLNLDVKRNGINLRLFYKGEEIPTFVKTR